MLDGAGRRNSSGQPRRLALALGLLLIALITLLVKDRQFWFGSEQATIDSDMPESTATPQTTKNTKNSARAATVAKKQVRAVAAASEAAPADNSGVAVTRTALPPLDVEVVAGDKHHKIHPGTNATHVEIPNPVLANTDNLAATTNAAEREPLAAAQPQASISASYPLLAQHMNVQGSVILQAIISAEGVVQDLRVMSGPAILSTAAQQAVREWRFKPVLQNGQAVETKARITVNFSIKVADNSASTTIAESRASDILIVSR
jgi:TonB family protein